MAQVQPAPRVQGQHERQSVGLEVVDKVRGVVQEQDGRTLEPAELVGVVGMNLFVGPWVNR
jgi:hypothetical protein